MDVVDPTKSSESMSSKSDAELESDGCKPDVDETSNENNINTNTSSSWWGWMESAKEKSSEAYQFMKRDLKEFKETVSSDAANVMSGTVSYVKDAISGIGQMVQDDGEEEEDKNEKEDSCAEELVKKDVGEGNEEKTGDNEKVEEDELAAFTNKAKEKLSAIFETIGSAFIVNRNYDDDDEMIVMAGDEVVPIERWKTLLKMIQTDPHTYYHEPDGPPEDYETWLASFNLIDYQSHMTHLLETVVEMNEFYCQLVPHSLSDVEFWHRYYYKVHQLKDLERKRANKLSKISTHYDSSEDNTQHSANNPVQIKLLEEGKESSMREDCGSKSEDSTPSPPSSDAKQSDSDWEKADLSDGLDDLNKKLNEKLIMKEECKSDDELSGSDWVKLN